MSNIAKRPDGRWRARYRDIAGKEHSRHFTRKLDAHNWRASVTTVMGAGTYVDPVSARITLGEWSQQWLATKVDLKETTRETYGQLLRTHVLPVWQNVKLADITHGAVAAWVADLTASGLAAIHGAADPPRALARSDACGARRAPGPQPGFGCPAAAACGARAGVPGSRPGPRARRRLAGTGWRSCFWPTPVSASARWPRCGCAAWI